MEAFLNIHTSYPTDSVGLLSNNPQRNFVSYITGIGPYVLVRACRRACHSQLLQVTEVSGQLAWQNRTRGDPKTDKLFECTRTSCGVKVTGACAFTPGFISLSPTPARQFYISRTANVLWVRQPVGISP